MNVGTRPAGTALKRTERHPVSKKQTAVTRNSTSWKNMISFLFAGNYASHCVNTVHVYWIKAGLLCVTECMSGTR